MRITADRVVRGVPPDRALAWWTDFQPGTTDHAFLPGERREILSRSDAGVEMEDRFLFVWKERTTARVEGNAVRFRGRNGLASFEGAYTFLPEGDGTRIRLDADLHLARGLGWTRLAARPVARWIIALDLAGHARDLRRDLGR